MTEEELEEIKRRAFKEGVHSVWAAIAKVTLREGDYNRLYNAVHGIEKYPDGFYVKIDSMHE